ncbi:MAG: plastocyanin/azurin family copper-binding protein [Thermoleophilaceae bacterium]
MCRRLGVAAVPVLLGVLAVGVQPAHAVHLFPLTPVFDPLGHDCAKNLQAAPETPSAGEALVVGFSFIDRDSKGSNTTIEAGESVTWEWLANHCHSVTFSDPQIGGTAGEQGFEPNQPELVRMNGNDHAFTVTFEEPGTYSYLCVHHAGVGMTGTVEVTPSL